MMNMIDRNSQGVMPVGAPDMSEVPIESATAERRAAGSAREDSCEFGRLRAMLLLAHGDFALFHPGAVCAAAYAAE